MSRLKSCLPLREEEERKDRTAGPCPTITLVGRPAPGNESYQAPVLDQTAPRDGPLHFQARGNFYNLGAEIKC